MSAKRPRPAVPVLVHVDNPAEVGSVTVDTSTIEGKMDTVITNQNRIYDKIPTSSGGGSADLTTVNANTTALAEAIGSADSASGDNDLVGLVKNLRNSIGIFGSGIPADGTAINSFLFNLRTAVGNSTVTPTTTGNSVRDLLTAIKENTASGGSGGGADLTTVNEKITALAETIGSANSTYEAGNLLGRVKNISRVIGDFNVPLTLTDTDLRSLLYNVRETVGNFNTGVNASATTIRSLLYNLSVGVGSITSSPTTTGSSVRDLLTAIKQNTASGGSGGSADLTTVNEKTTALAAAIGSASDDSSTVSVIGLLKSITDKY